LEVQHNGCGSSVVQPWIFQESQINVAILETNKTIQWTLLK